MQLDSTIISALRSAGVPEESIGTNKPCPICGGSDRFSISVYGGKIRYFCRQHQGHQQTGDIYTLIRDLRGCDFKQAKELLGEVKAKQVVVKFDYGKLTRLMNGAVKLSSKTLAGQYLEARACPFPEHDVWYQPKAWGTENGKAFCAPAMVALIRSVSGEVIGAHKTFLEGRRKRPGDNAKQMMKIKELSGGAVRLFKPSGNFIGLSEGIETALSASALFSVPTWACLSAYFLENVELPPEIRSVIIFSDNDKSFTGQKSAFTLAHRLAAKEIEVSVQIPISGDWNDELIERGVSNG